LASFEEIISHQTVLNLAERMQPGVIPKNQIFSKMVENVSAETRTQRNRKRNVLTLVLAGRKMHLHSLVQSMSRERFCHAHESGPEATMNIGNPVLLSHKLVAGVKTT